MNSHTKARPFKCPYEDCDKDYIEDKHLKQHVKAAHTNERDYVCQVPGCGKSFVTGTRLKRHQLVHEGAERFRCQDCGQSFRKRETLTKHVRKDHLHVRAYACSEQGCTESFDSKPALKRHRDKMHGNVKFWCADCGVGQQRVGFTTELQLHEHLKKEHQDCLFCDYKSSSRWDLDQHVDMYHSGKTVKDRKVIACTHPGCDKKFTKKSNMATHIRTAHEGVRFVCGEYELDGPDFEDWPREQGCGHRLSTKARLEDHVRLRHLGLPRPTKMSKPLHQPESETALIDEISGMTNLLKQTIFCPECNEGFARYHDLEVHLSKGHDALNTVSTNMKSTTTTQHDAPPFYGSLLESGLQPNPLDFSQASWPDHPSQEALFTAPLMDGVGPHDPWFQDQADILLLAGDNASPSLELDIDPCLTSFCAASV